MKLCSGAFENPNLPSGFELTATPKGGLIPSACSNGARAASRLLHLLLSLQLLVCAGRERLDENPNKHLLAPQKVTQVDLLAKELALGLLSLRCSELQPTRGRGMGLEMRSRAGVRKLVFLTKSRY